MSNPLRDSSITREEIARIFNVDLSLSLPLIYVDIDPPISTAHVNPEQDVVDEIDELVNESLKHRDEEYSERCDVCGGEWHALTGKLGCPGMFANDEARAVFRGESNDSSRGLDCSYAEMDGIPVNPHTLQPLSDDIPHYYWGTDL
jgi:hypothetical protein